MTKAFAHGRRSEIFRITNNEILKLYDGEFLVEKVHEEFDKSLRIWELGKISTPKLIQEVKYKNRHGIKFEKIEGINLLDLFQKKPWEYPSYRSIIAEMHRNIHANKLTGLPSQNELFRQLISDSKRIPQKDKRRLLTILNDTGAQVLCHGDFHPGNLILTDQNEIYVIDWMDSFIGDHRLDVALTAVSSVVSTAPDHIPLFYRCAYEILKRILKPDRGYIHDYGLESIDEYLYLAAAIHLARYEGTNLRVHQKYFDKSIKREANSN